MNSSLLLIEDDEALRLRLQKALASRGITTIACATGADALAQIKGKALAAAVVDLKLPDTTGLDLIDALLAVQPQLPIVVLSGFGSISMAIEAVRRGAKDFLTKPASVDQILRALHGERGQTEPDSPGAPPEFPSLGRVEWEHIQRVLAECQGNISKTARHLGIDRRSLQRKLGKYPPPR